MSQHVEAHPAPTAGAAAYNIDQHNHLFAAWAASRAASVKGCRFQVEQGRAILEACDFRAEFSQPDMLPTSMRIDDEHREWRASVIRAAGEHGLEFTHGVAAKIINCYLKVRFVCGGHHAHERVGHLHPPVDAVLLKTLADLNVGGYAKQWRKAHQTRWSKFTSDHYELVIELIRESLKGEPLWKIEEHWQGNQ